MISDGLVLCCDIVITFLCVPPLILLLSPIWFYKTLVHLLVRLLHPEWIPLTKNDGFTVWDVFKGESGGKHVYNVGVVVRANGIVSVNSVRQRVIKEVLGDRNGTKVYPRLFEQFVLFGGYAFRTILPKLDVGRQIRQLSLGTHTLATFKATWIEEPYGEGMAPWEIVVIPLTEVGETIALLKIHHALADAYSLLYLFDTFLDNQLPIPPQQPPDSFWRKTRQFLGAVRITIAYNNRICRASAPLLPFKSKSDTQSYVASTSLYFPHIKLIRRKTNASYTAIMLSIFGSVITHALEDHKNPASANQSDSRKMESSGGATFVQLSFPWPNHPLVQLCNHWTCGGIRVSLGPQSPLQRLHQTQTDYETFISTDIHKVMKRYLFPIGLLFPVKIFKSAFEMTRRMSGLRTIFTSVIGFNDKYYEFEGVPVISVTPLTGLLGTTPVISGLAFGYKDQMQCSFTASEELVKDQVTMDTIVNSYFGDELEKLVEGVNGS